MSTTANEARIGINYAPIPVRLALAGFRAVEYTNRMGVLRVVVFYRNGEEFSRGTDFQELINEALEFVDAHERLTKGR